MRRAGNIGWLGLTAYIALWDAYASETLSGAFGRAILHPKARWPVTAAWCVTTAHLFGVLPKRYDPLLRVGQMMRRQSISKALVEVVTKAEQSS